MEEKSRKQSEEQSNLGSKDSKIWTMRMIEPGMTKGGKIVLGYYPNLESDQIFDVCCFSSQLLTRSGQPTQSLSRIVSDLRRKYGGFMRYGFSGGADAEALRVLDRLHIEHGYHGDQENVLDVDVAWNVRMIRQEHGEAFAYSYLIEGNVVEDNEAGCAAFYMYSDEQRLHVYDLDMQEYWINRLKEKPLQQWEVLPF